MKIISYEKESKPKWYSPGLTEETARKLAKHKGILKETDYRLENGTEKFYVRLTIEYDKRCCVNVPLYEKNEVLSLLKHTGKRGIKGLEGRTVEVYYDKDLPSCEQIKGIGIE
jgi:hypothetical protein